MSISHLTFHGFEGLVELLIFANGNVKVVEGCGRSAAITGNYAADC